ncbi:MAG TPA: CaiB/BaiF CoA-transferase family protein [Candidatus Sulfotelmatobacter sp.]|nr:CaiB/BaiF CoA-transferase family protein [Candidatus Sulfotelmatobacter sp.]
MTADSNLPLKDIRVVALEQAVAAPFCSRQLADMGADVIKIERPDGGDFARAYDGALNGLSAYFAWLNRGKRSITLDLKKAKDHLALAKLVERADVFIHNLTPDAVESFGFAYESVAQTNPGLIWCGISGYGSDGPYRNKKAYDLMVQGESGVMNLTGGPDTPAKVGISIADIAAGLYGYSSILAALLNRARSARGERIDISMLECLTEWVTPALYAYQGSGRIPKRAGMRHNMIVPYGVYACADGVVNFAIQNDREWHRFSSVVLSMPTLINDERFVTNEVRVRHRVELETIIEQYLRTLKRSEVLGRLEEAQIAHGEMNDVAAVIQHPQLAARRRWVQVDSPNGTIPALVPPHNLRNAPARMMGVPALGEHSQEILAELGLWRME